MKYFIVAAFACCTFFSCKLSDTNPGKEANKELATMLHNYYEERLQHFPLEATSNGDYRYNDLLNIDFTDSYRTTLHEFYNRYHTYINSYERENLNRQDRLSYDDFKREVEINLEGLKFKDNNMPFHQFWGLPLTMGQLASAFPYAGGPYLWASILGGRGCGWATACLGLIGLVTAAAAVNLGTCRFVISACSQTGAYEIDAGLGVRETDATIQCGCGGAQFHLELLCSLDVARNWINIEARSPLSARSARNSEHPAFLSRPASYSHVN